MKSQNAFLSLFSIMKGMNRMLCQRCQKNHANLFYKESVNGNERSYALCSDCAAELKASGELSTNLGTSLFDMPIFDMGLNIPNTSALYGSLFGYPAGKTKRGGASPLQGSKRCNLCGSTYADIMKNGKLGCARCYTNFEQELGETLRTIHGNVKHIGRSPKQFRTKNEKHNKLEKLKDQLARAIEAEEFENAAKLRDQIKELENK